MSVDRRSRGDGPVEPVEPIDPGAFFGHDLPAAVAAHAPALAPALRWYRPRPLTVRCAGGRWTLRSRRGRIVATEGGGGPAIALTARQLTDLALDLATPMAWFGDGSLRSTAPIGLLLDWWVLLRGALDGRAPYIPRAVALAAGARPAAPGPAPPAPRTFRADDAPESLRGFLESAGYLHVAGVFTPAEMAAVSADMDRAGRGLVDARAQPGAAGDEPWWGVEDGRRPVRLPRFEADSPAAAELLADDRLAALGRLTGDGHALGAHARPGIEALVRPLGGPHAGASVPWHTDCAFGRHSYDCASLTVGVAVTGTEGTDGPGRATGAGRLRVLAGSHRELLWPAFLRPGCDLPTVALPTAPGDVTVHLSCTLHMAPAPVGHERRALYTAFGLPPRAGAAAGVA
jgi:hypothetical protein